MSSGMTPAAATRMPLRQRVTPCPTASTTPAQSTPGLSGRMGPRAPSLPARRLTSSTRLTVAACTRMRISPARGCGSGTSSYLRTSGGPNWRMMAAFMRVLSVDGDAGLAHDALPFGGIGLDQIGKFRSGEDEGIDEVGRQALACIGVISELAHIAVECIDDLARRCARREQREPGRGLESG